MKLNIMRSVKHLIFLVLTFAIIYGAMLVFGATDIEADRFMEFLSTRRGMMMVVAVIGLAALYPFYGVTTKKLKRVGSAEIIIAMNTNGFKLKEKSDNKMVFVAVNISERLRLRFDDTLEIDNTSDDITRITGSRRAVYSVLYKLGGEVL